MNVWRRLEYFQDLTNRAVPSPSQGNPSGTWQCLALCLPLFYANAFGPQTSLQPLEVGKQTRAISTLQ